MGLKINRKKPESFYVEKALREQNAKLRDIIREMHALAREQSSFMHGVLVCELIDNPSDNVAYETASRILGQGMTKMTQLATQELVGK
jgi:hypothetical protein